MRVLLNPLQHQVSDSQVAYLGHDVLGNIEKLEELKEGVVYVMENLNFLPDENSYVSPWVDPEEEEKKESIEIRDEAEDAVASGKAAAAKDTKKMSAAEKKKAEEEAKKKAEEDSKAAEAAANSAES